MYKIISIYIDFYQNHHFMYEMTYHILGWKPVVARCMKNMYYHSLVCPIPYKSISENVPKCELITRDHEAHRFTPTSKIIYTYFPSSMQMQHSIKFQFSLSLVPPLHHILFIKQNGTKNCVIFFMQKFHNIDFTYLLMTQSKYFICTISPHIYL